MTPFKFSIKFFIIGLVIFSILARIVPRFFIQNDIEKLAGGESQAVEYAEQVLWMIGHGLCSQLAALTCTGVKIVELKPIKTTFSNSKKLPVACRYPYEGKAEVYGLFGIPSHQIIIDCDLHWYSVSAMNGAELSFTRSL
ncbi:MAG: hypothetical protein KME06_09195 [Kastovskya adunca ATA6-11-RM4]|jgi:hypothetical protein|nr:hypothetical protein [Kastovskya adunca ATA6-11-RM4]